MPEAIVDARHVDRVDVGREAAVRVENVLAESVTQAITSSP